MRPLTIVVMLGLLVVPTALCLWWMGAADDRLAATRALTAEEQPAVAVAQQANEDYCTPELKQILRRVLASCGLIGGSGGRGCQPLEAKNVATMSDEDFNALFTPMQDRGGIAQFELASAELDAADKQLIDKVFADRAGASYFLVVARASPDGPTKQNRTLSEERAKAVMNHIEQTFQDPELNKQVGMLWLGEEYAQLDPSFCQWSRSGQTGECSPEDLNRSAFLAWIDCRL